MKKRILFFLMITLLLPSLFSCSPKVSPSRPESEPEMKTESETNPVFSEESESPSAIETEAEAPTEPPVVYTPAKGQVYAMDTVNIRKAPDTDSAILGKLGRNRSIDRIASGDNGWTLVSYENSTGYIASEYLTENRPASPEAPADNGESFAVSLKASQGASQLICVVAEGNQCTLTMHQKNKEGLWEEILHTDGVIGANGLYKEKEGDKKTPVGVFSFIKAFGLKEDPGTAFPYTKVDDTMHWVDDPESKYYNLFVSTRDVTPDWTSSEHLIEYVTAYNYCLALNYNPERTPYKGCAIFLHCPKPDKTPTSGCIGIPEKDMLFIMQHIQTNCKIVISDENIIYRY